MAAIKTFDLLDTKTGQIVATYKNRQPRKAAIKAAGAGHKEILLREAGTQMSKRAAKVHEFKGSNEIRDFPLPYPRFAVAKAEKQAGKPLPADLNKKGKEAELLALGFQPIKYSRGKVKKVTIHNVQKVGGLGVQESVEVWAKSRAEKLALASQA